jgi:hypothetical protein
MSDRFILTDYVESAMAKAELERFEDGSYGGRIPQCTSVVPFAETRDACESELRSVLEDLDTSGLKRSAIHYRKSPESI